MNKVLLGLLLGALLGAIDGGTAWFTPSVRAQFAAIIVGSTIKGLIAGGASLALQAVAPMTLRALKRFRARWSARKIARKAARRAE